jgi:hypothetical protein
MMLLERRRGQADERAEGGEPVDDRARPVGRGDADGMPISTSTPPIASQAVYGSARQISAPTDWSSVAKEVPRFPCVRVSAEQERRAGRHRGAVRG